MLAADLSARCVTRLLGTIATLAWLSPALLQMYLASRAIATSSRAELGHKWYIGYKQHAAMFNYSKIKPSWWLVVSPPESLAVCDGGPDVPSDVVMASSVQTLHLGMVFVYNNHCDSASPVELETKVIRRFLMILQSWRYREGPY